MQVTRGKGMRREKRLDPNSPNQRGVIWAIGNPTIRPSLKHGCIGEHGGHLVGGLQIGKGARQYPEFSLVNVAASIRNRIAYQHHAIVMLNPGANGR